jgi:Flp pilus assembly protein TadB
VGGGRGYIRGMLDDFFAAKNRAPFSEWGLCRQVVGLVLAVVTLGLWVWLVSQAVTYWLPKWLVLPIGFAFIAFAAVYYARDWWLRRVELRRDRLPRRPKQARGIVADDLPFRADRD